MASKTLAGRYEPGELLSTTPMSQVCVATDSLLERRVVLKLLAPNADHARFEREAHAVAGLAHPNIVQLFDYGHEDGTAYMVLEYLPGGTLADRLERSRGLPDDEIAQIAADAANGLEYAHGHGIVHRTRHGGSKTPSGSRLASCRCRRARPRAPLSAPAS
jgi:eukaryotic-like serine/threonine-protein kinase